MFSLSHFGQGIEQRFAGYTAQVVGWLLLVGIVILLL
jgi:hypothetical protein